MLSYHSSHRLFAYAVTVSVKMQGEETLSASIASSAHKDIFKGARLQDMTSTATTGSMSLLECPMCDFTVRPTDDYILQLHFEQAHTTDSPFIIEDDPEPLPPSLPRPSSKRMHANQGTPASNQQEGTVLCPEPECGELVLLDDFNDHLNYHAAETLSFDETTQKYRSHRSHRSSTTMALVAGQHPHTGLSKDSLERRFSTDLPSSLKRSDHHGRSPKKSHRSRSNTSSSGKSTISRSIVSFNPFAKPEKTVKPPIRSARLGASSLHILYVRIC